MKKSKSTNEQWAALYEAAAAFKQTAPWEWMADRDIFGVSWSNWKEYPGRSG
jgi:hypothetical protein